MKSHMISKAKISTRAVATPQQAAFELKHRVILAINKLADRDTHQIGVDELEKMAHGLTPEGIAPFLSCITDIDAEQKTAVRKESVMVMGTIARCHGALLVPHTGKMVASIVKRLKDSDSVVRDACAETAGVLATSVAGEAAFVVIVKPLFEALGEQNRYVQTGSALCLARVIDEAAYHPSSILPQMLSRVVKLLKNPHFMAKPAVIELIRSIVQAGGASTENALSTALTSILETLKSTDWATRKAASAALACIAICAGPLVASFKVHCLRSLESCRFDKVKPVRDGVMHALQCWKTLSGTVSLEPSEAGSSTKENMNGDFADVSSASDGAWIDRSCRKVGPGSALSSSSTNESKKRNPLTARKNCPNYVQNCHHPSSDWHIEISLPKTHTISSVGSHVKEFGGSCASIAFERTEDENNGQDVKYDYERVEENVECCSMSDLVSGSLETKDVNIDDGNSENLIGHCQRSATEEIDPESHVMKERKSLDSTVTDLSSCAMRGCCLHAANELAFIKKQLLEIEAKQSNLLDLLQAFMGNSGDNLSMLQLKVHNLEHEVDKISKNIFKDVNHSNMASSKFMKNIPNVSSSPRLSTSTPRLSTSTPRPSVESNYRQPSLASLNNKEVWGVNPSSNSRSRTSVKEVVEIWRDPTLSILRNNVLPKDSGRSARTTASSQTIRTGDVVLVSAGNTSSKQGKIDDKNDVWKQIKEFLHSGDMESAYAKALCTGGDLHLIELMDRTGPVLEMLSCVTSSTIVSFMSAHFLNQRFIDSIIPWFLQAVDLFSAREPWRLDMSANSQRRFLCALREAAAMEIIERVDRIAITECAAKLRQLWGSAPNSKKMLAARGPRGSKSLAPAIVAM